MSFFAHFLSLRMQQSLSISIERDLSSVTTSIHSNENKLEKWRRLNKRIIRFFRLMKISIVRLRFIDMLVRMNIDEIESDELKTYETRKFQEDLAFLDDVKRFVSKLLYYTRRKSIFFTHFFPKVIMKFLIVLYQLVSFGKIENFN